MDEIIGREVIPGHAGAISVLGFLPGVEIGVVIPRGYRSFWMARTLFSWRNSPALVRFAGPSC